MQATLSQRFDHPYRRPLRWPVLVSLLCLLALPLATARGAGLLVADGPFGGALEIQEHTVDVVINNGVAVTTIHQTFLNTENRTVEALYTFPVPQNASVADFSMWINGVEMVGEVVEKKRAREIYNSYKQQPRPRDPGLLEQVNYKTFELRIFPIAARAQQRIRVVYYQQLDFDHDWATYVYPLATTTVPNINANVTGKFGLRLQVKSDIPITELQSTSHADEFVVANHTRYFSEASLEAQGQDLSRDLVLSFKTSRPRTGVNVITSKPDGEDGYFLLTLTPGEELANAPGISEAKDYVFVLDISGSMANQGKLGLSKSTLGAFINTLDPQDRMELISFNIQPTAAFNQLTAADDASKTKALAMLNAQQARGGTQLAPALNLAYRYSDPDRPLVIVLMSDGMTEQRERDELQRLLTQRPQNARVFAIGVGNEVNRPLLSQLAQDTGGLSAFLSQGDDFNRQAQAFRRKLARPIATDVKIDFDSAVVYDLQGSEHTTLYHGSPIRIYGRYKSAANQQSLVQISANVLGNALKQEVAIDLPDADQGNPEIERMWAWHRVDGLLKQAERTGSRDAVISEIIRLGEAYSIVTEYTSFLVLENDSEYQRWNIDRKNALRVKRDQGAQEKVRSELDRLRAKSSNASGPPSAENMNLAQQSQQPGNVVNTQTQRSSQPQSQSQPQERRGRDLNFGGGSLDPFLAFLAIGMGGVLLITAIRHRKTA